MVITRHREAAVPAFLIFFGDRFSETFDKLVVGHAAGGIELIRLGRLAVLSFKSLLKAFEKAFFLSSPFF